MRRLVQVELVELGTASRLSRCGIDEQGRTRRPAPGRPVPQGLGVVLGRQMVWARAGTGRARRSAPGHGMSDEHFAVAIDSCEERRWRECADVLYRARPLTHDAAAQSLWSMVTRHPGCRLAAVPVEGGGWVVASGPDCFRMVLRLHAGHPEPARADWSLLPSCLHGWLATGHSLRELPTVGITHCRNPAPAIHRAGEARPDTP